MKIEVEDLAMKNVPHVTKEEKNIKSDIIDKSENIFKKKSETLGEIEKKRQKVIELIKEENDSKPSIEPLAKQTNENNLQNSNDQNLVNRLNLAKNKNNGKKYQKSQKILNIAQELEKHLNGTAESSLTENKAISDEYMNILLDKPVKNNNKKMKMKKINFSEIQ